MRKLWQLLIRCNHARKDFGVRFGHWLFTGRWVGKNISSKNLLVFSDTDRERVPKKSLLRNSYLYPEVEETLNCDRKNLDEF